MILLQRVEVGSVGFLGLQDDEHILRCIVSHIFVRVLKADIVREGVLSFELKV